MKFVIMSPDRNKCSYLFVQYNWIYYILQAGMGYHTEKNIDIG